MFEEALVGRLQLADDVAFYADARISWFGFNRGELGPRVALSIITQGETWTHDGHDGLDQPRVRCDVIGEDDMAVTGLARALRREMRRAVDVEGIRFHPAECAADRSFEIEERDGGLLQIRRQLEFLFFFEEI